MNTTALNEKLNQIAKFEMIQAYATAALSSLSGGGCVHFFDMERATKAARKYAEYTGRDFYSVRDEMLEQFIWNN